MINEVGGFPDIISIPAAMECSRLLSRCMKKALRVKMAQNLRGRCQILIWLLFTWLISDVFLSKHTRFWSKIQPLEPYLSHIEAYMVGKVADLGETKPYSKRIFLKDYAEKLMTALWFSNQTRNKDMIQCTILLVCYEMRREVLVKPRYASETRSRSGKNHSDGALLFLQAPFYSFRQLREPTIRQNFFMSIRNLSLHSNSGTGESCKPPKNELSNKGSASRHWDGSFFLSATHPPCSILQNFFYGNSGI